MYSHNESSKKQTYNLYNEFKKKYRVPEEYIENFLLKDSAFRVYNTPEEQESYIKKWTSLS
jgi:hypothetical protein